MTCKKQAQSQAAPQVLNMLSGSVMKVGKPKKKKRKNSDDQQPIPAKSTPDILLITSPNTVSTFIHNTSAQTTTVHHPNLVSAPARPLISLPRLRYDCINREYSIVVIPSDRSFLFFGWAGITCLGGSVQIDGFGISASSFETPEKMFHVCAPVEASRPAIIECTTAEALSIKELRVKYRLKEVSPEFEKVMYEWSNSTAAILIVHRRTPVVVDLYKQMHENNLYLNQSHWRPQGIDILENPGWNLYRRCTFVGLNLALAEVNMRRNEGGKVTMMPVGSKSSGKSTFVRYLCNRLLASELPLYVLDLDLGQPEFTPAGCMSLWKITKPLLDTPWCHQKADFENCYFYGDLSPADDIQKYKNIFMCLLNSYKENSPPGSVLVINPMGWIEGPGLEIVQHIADWAEPEYIFQLTGGHFKQANIRLKETTKPVIILRDFPLREKGKEWDKIAGKLKLKALKPSALRDLRTVGYFSSMMNKPLMYTLNQAKMVRIDFQKATFAVPEDLSSVDDRFFFGTLNVQVVALCSTAEPLPARRLLGKKHLPLIYSMHQKSPLLQCYGYGIINAVDMTRKQIILLTPISPASLAKVTVLARGNRIVLPSVMTKTANGAPTMYTTGPTDPSQSINADLYGSLRMDRQQNFHREHFPVTQ